MKKKFLVGGVVAVSVMALATGCNNKSKPRDNNNNVQTNNTDSQKATTVNSEIKKSTDCKSHDVISLKQADGSIKKYRMDQTEIYTSTIKTEEKGARIIINDSGENSSVISEILEGNQLSKVDSQESTFVRDTVTDITKVSNEISKATSKVKAQATAKGDSFLVQGDQKVKNLTQESLIEIEYKYENGKQVITTMKINGAEVKQEENNSDTKTETDGTIITTTSLKAPQQDEKNQNKTLEERVTVCKSKVISGGNNR